MVAANSVELARPVIHCTVRLLLIVIPIKMFVDIIP